jgi:hypothetical protein
MITGGQVSACHGRQASCLSWKTGFQPVLSLLFRRVIHAQTRHRSRNGQCRPLGLRQGRRANAMARVSKPTTPVAPDPTCWRNPPQAGPWHQDTPPLPRVKRARQTSQPGKGSDAGDPVPGPAGNRCCATTRPVPTLSPPSGRPARQAQNPFRPKSPSALARLTTPKTCPEKKSK